MDVMDATELQRSHSQEQHLAPELVGSLAGARR